jgi:hypothetical protein
MTITRHKDVKLDGSAPALLYGYGGFNIDLTPRFSTSWMTWVSSYRGVLAVPNLRGGGEYGEAWHEGGIREKKQNVSRHPLLSFSLSLSLVECCSLNIPLKCLSRPSTTSSVRLDTSSTTRFVSSLLSDRASFLSRHLTRLLALPFDSLLPRVRSSPAPRIQSSFKPLIPSFASLLRSLYRQTHHERRIQRRSARRCLH